MSKKEFYFEDLEVGAELTTKGRTVTETDVVNFAGVSGDFTELHMNREVGKSSVFFQNIAHGLCTLSIVSGLIVGERSFLDKTMAFFGIKDWQYKKPVFFGDTIWVKVLISSKNPTNNKNGGLVTFDIQVFNQRKETIQQGQWLTMIEKKTN